MLTLLEARQGPLKDVAGACTNSPEFRQQLNQATRQLMMRGDFVGTVVPMRFCVSAGCVVFNRYVGEIRQTNICNGQTSVKSLYDNFISKGYYEQWCGSPVALTQWGRVPIYQDVLGEQRLIRAYPRYPQDVGKTIRIFGTDDNGQTLVTNNGDGTYTAGVVITLAQPYGSTNVFVRSIEKVIKEKTQGPIDCYSYNTVTNLLEDLAHYEPSETLPSYARYKLHGCCATSILSLVKLAYVPVEVDTDFVVLANEDALEIMFQSNKLRQAGDIKSARALIADAVEVLNRQLENSFPVEQTPVKIGSLACIGQQRVF